MLLLNASDCGSASRPVLAIYLLYGYRLIQGLLIVYCTGLNNFHAGERFHLHPHNGAALRAIVVRNILAAVTFANERTVSTRQLLVLESS